MGFYYTYLSNPSIKHMFNTIHLITYNSQCNTLNNHQRKLLTCTNIEHHQKSIHKLTTILFKLRLTLTVSMKVYFWCCRTKVNTIIQYINQIENLQNFFTGPQIALKINCKLHVTTVLNGLQFPFKVSILSINFRSKVNKKTQINYGCNSF